MSRVDYLKNFLYDYHPEVLYFMPKFRKYHISSIEAIFSDLFIVKVIPKSGKSFNYLPGQYCQIINPKYTIDKHRLHYFSIASKIDSNNLEFCIKIYGNWTKALSKLHVGDTILLSSPKGNFYMEAEDQTSVFLVGGIGISPVISMLRSVNKGRFTLLYGNRTPEFVAYREELNNIKKKIDLKVVNIYSHISPSTITDGYIGFISKDILDKEVDFNTNPTFFLIGPPVFVTLMETLLRNEYKVKKIKKELVS